MADILPFPTVNQTEEEIILERPIIPADLKGLEYILGVQRLMQNAEIKPELVLEYIADKLLLKNNAMTTYYDFHENVYTMKYSSQNICLEPELYLGMPWDEYERQNKENWEAQITPVWKDETFTNELNEFIYPFYDGDKRLGLVVVHTWDSIKNVEQAFYVEVLVESTRGYFLHRNQLNEGINIIEIEEVKKENVGLKTIVVSFFKKLFGMAA
jgi:hypothetical protein